MATPVVGSQAVSYFGSAIAYGRLDDALHAYRQALTGSDEHHTHPVLAYLQATPHYHGFLERVIFSSFCEGANNGRVRKLCSALTPLDLSGPVPLLELYGYFGEVGFTDEFMEILQRIVNKTPSFDWPRFVQDMRRARTNREAAGRPTTEHSVMGDVRLVELETYPCWHIVNTSTTSNRAGDSMPCSTSDLAGACEPLLTGQAQREHHTNVATGPMLYATAILDLRYQVITDQQAVIRFLPGLRSNPLPPDIRYALLSLGLSYEVSTVAVYRCLRMIDIHILDIGVVPASRAEDHVSDDDTVQCEVFGHRLMVFPILHQKDWTLAIIDVGCRTFQIYDPTPGQRLRLASFDTVIRFLTRVNELAGRSDRWTQTIADEPSYQFSTNSADSAIHVMVVAAWVLLGNPYRNASIPFAPPHVWRRIFQDMLLLHGMHYLPRPWSIDEHETIWCINEPMSAPIVEARRLVLTAERIRRTILTPLNQFLAGFRSEQSAATTNDRMMESIAFIEFLDRRIEDHNAKVVWWEQSAIQAMYPE